MLFAAASALALLSAVSAQSVMTVQVGSTANAPGGIFQFIPNTLNATKGTVITFQFVGAPGNHSVTQSTFADPCDPTPGGFDSGWVLIPSTAPAQVPEWNLTITDDTKPIWFFCKQLLPSPHCGQGMVGAINAPATGNTFAAFQNNAKNFGKASGQGEGGLVGIGASASAPVGPIPSGVTTFIGSPVGSATGSGSAAGSSATSPASGSGSASASGSGSGSPSPSPTGSGAISVAANSLVAIFAATIGFVLA